MKFLLPVLPNATEEFPPQFVFTRRLVVDDPLGGTENGHAQPTENMRYVTITTVRPTTRGADPIDSPYSVLSVHILKLNFQTFMAFFGFGFGAIQDKAPVLENRGQAGAQIRMRISAGRLASLSGISNDGNKISYCIVDGHINEGLAVAYQDALMTPGTLP